MNKGLGRALSWVIVAIIVVQTIAIFKLSYGIIDTMVSLKYEEGVDALTRAYGLRIQVYALIVILQFIVNIVLLWALRRCGSFGRTTANIVYFTLLAAQVVFAAIWLWLICGLH